jgi:hypothetical protein
MRTQSPHSTHLFGSRRSEGEETSMATGVRVWGKRTLSTPRRWPSFWSWQEGPLEQEGQSPTWEANRSSITILRSLRICWLVV